MQPAGGAGLVFGPMERTADPDGQSTTAADELVYTIRKGDTWSGIALTFYGTASRAEELLEANVGRQQADGRRINRQGWIYAGWTIRIPRPTRGVVMEENGPSPAAPGRPW